MNESRKKTVQKYGSPPEERWHDEGTVGDIIRDIEAPLGSRNLIVEILRNILQCQSSGIEYSAKKREKLII